MDIMLVGNKTTVEVILLLRELQNPTVSYVTAPVLGVTYVIEKNGSMLIWPFKKTVNSKP